MQCRGARRQTGEVTTSQMSKLPLPEIDKPRRGICSARRSPLRSSSTKSNSPKPVLTCVFIGGIAAQIVVSAAAQDTSEFPAHNFPEISKCIGRLCGAIGCRPASRNSTSTTCLPGGQAGAGDGAALVENGSKFPSQRLLRTRRSTAQNDTPLLVSFRRRWIDIMLVA